MESEMEISYSQARLSVEELGHQPTHNPFDSKCVVLMALVVYVVEDCLVRHQCETRSFILGRLN